MRVWLGSGETSSLHDVYCLKLPNRASCEMTSPRFASATDDGEAPGCPISWRHVGHRIVDGHVFFATNSHHPHYEDSTLPLRSIGCGLDWRRRRRSPVRREGSIAS